MPGCHAVGKIRHTCNKPTSVGYYPSFGSCVSAHGTRINPCLLTCGRSAVVVEASKEIKLRRGR